MKSSRIVKRLQKDFCNLFRKENDFKVKRKIRIQFNQFKEIPNEYGTRT